MTANMLPNHMLKASLALSILILTTSLFITNAISFEIESTTADVVEYNPFTSGKTFHLSYLSSLTTPSGKWPKHPSEIPADGEFIDHLFKPHLQRSSKPTTQQPRWVLQHYLQTKVSPLSLQSVKEAPVADSIWQ